MDDQFLVVCPYCGEQIEIYVEPDVRGSFVQDCEVCCNPWRVRVTGRGEDRDVHVTRADGSSSYSRNRSVRQPCASIVSCASCACLM